MTTTSDAVTTAAPKPPTPEEIALYCKFVWPDGKDSEIETKLMEKCPSSGNFLIEDFRNNLPLYEE